MAINREDLKIGETYLSDEGYERTIFGIGESSIFYKNGVFETTSSIDIFIKYHHIKPKPKKTVELAGYLRSDGMFIEFTSDTTLKDWDMFEFKKVSTRTIEIDE